MRAGVTSSLPYAAGLDPHYLGRVLRAELLLVEVQREAAAYDHTSPSSDVATANDLVARSVLFRPDFEELQVRDDVVRRRAPL